MLGLSRKLISLVWLLNRKSIVGPLPLVILLVWLWNRKWIVGPLPLVISLFWLRNRKWIVRPMPKLMILIVWAMAAMKGLTDFRWTASTRWLSR